MNRDGQSFIIIYALVCPITLQVNVGQTVDCAHAGGRTTTPGSTTGRCFNGSVPWVISGRTRSS